LTTNTTARQAGARRHGDGERQSDGRRRVESGAAVAQNVATDRGRRRLVGGDEG